MHTAVALLPPVADVGGDPLVPGPWCLSIPLWGNPALASPANPDSVDVPFADFRAAGVDALGGLLAVERAALAAPTHAEYERGVRGPLLAGSYAFAERHVACERAALLRAALPAEWVGAAVQAAAAPAGQLPAPAVVLAAMLLPRLGWPLPGREPVRVASLVVHAATALLTIEAAAACAAQYLAPFAALAAGAPPPPLPPLPPPLPSLPFPLPSPLRCLPWQSCRLSCGGCGACPGRTAGRKPSGGWRTMRCPPLRGCMSTSRAPAAQPSRAPAASTTSGTAPLPVPWSASWRPRAWWQLRQRRPRPLPPSLMSGWLGRRTACTLASGVWSAWQRWRPCITAGGGSPACGCAGGTGSSSGSPRSSSSPPGRASCSSRWTASCRQPAGDAGGGGPLVPPPPAPAAALERAAPDPDDPADFLPLASRSACKLFWTLLCDFAALGCAPASWPAALPHSHPFFRAVDGRLRLRPLPPMP